MIRFKHTLGNIILLLDLSRPAFRFVSLRRYESCKWNSNILESLTRSANLQRDKFIKMLKLMLPKLASGWFRQRGNVFGFGDYDQMSPKLLINKDIDLINKAPIRY